ncbi:ArsR/SmtB family transcription factor [Nocardia sp. NPDC088792]|uniref:ArsR/SmtB family transcription factor n=1 Tax=Nocardia sp. NPDC088792 TaxID=3364332 RepID=UPI0038193CFF
MASRTAVPLTHPDRDALSLIDVLSALSDPLRLAIVANLADGSEMPCTAFELPVSKSTQSWHFRTLREAGVIRQRDDGTRRLNSLRRTDIDARFPGLLDLAIREAATLCPPVLAERRTSTRP